MKYAGNGPLAGLTGDAYVAATSCAGAIVSKTSAVQMAFSNALGSGVFGNSFVAVCLFFFAFSTILGWNLFAKINIQWLFGEKAVKPFMLVALVFIFLGTIGGNDLVWALSDLFNNLMVLPNAIALFALTGLVTKVLADRNK